MEKYRVVMSRFIKYGDDGSATYEITFNRSLGHTGKFDGIADGLNAYEREEARKELTDAFVDLWHYFVEWVKSIFKR